MTYWFQKIPSILVPISWQFIAVATLFGQSSATEMNHLRDSSVPHRDDTVVRHTLSDSSLQGNPLRSTARSWQRSSLRTSVKNKGRSTRGRIGDFPSEPIHSVRQVSYQEDDLDTSFDELDDSDFENLPEPEEASETEEAPELGEAQEPKDVFVPESDESPDLAETVPMQLSDVRAPLKDNPFAEARQHDPQGLLSESLSGSRRVIIDEYSNITGSPRRNHLARYSAHRFHHNPLYFEETNLERYGNELEFQRISSAAKFLSNAALLPLKITSLPPCSRVTTLGFRRPGEFVPYREYPQIPASAEQFHQLSHRSQVR